MTRRALALPALAALLAGCGGGTTTSYTQIATPAPSRAASPTPTPSPTPSPSPSPSPTPSGPVDVDLSEWAVDASADSSPAGKVTFAIRNTGKLPHELAVLKTTAPADQLGGGSRVEETGLVDRRGGIQAGADAQLAVRLEPGHYSLICNLPGHYAAGMHTDFTVR